MNILSDKVRRLSQSVIQSNLLSIPLTHKLSSSHEHRELVSTDSRHLDERAVPFIKFFADERVSPRPSSRRRLTASLGPFSARVSAFIGVGTRRRALVRVSSCRRLLIRALVYAREAKRPKLTNLSLTV